MDSNSPAGSSGSPSISITVGRAQRVSPRKRRLLVDGRIVKPKTEGRELHEKFWRLQAHSVPFSLSGVAGFLEWLRPQGDAAILQGRVLPGVSPDQWSVRRYKKKGDGIEPTMDAGSTSRLFIIDLDGVPVQFPLDPLCPEDAVAEAVEWLGEPFSGCQYTWALSASASPGATKLHCRLFFLLDREVPWEDMKRWGDHWAPGSGVDGSIYTPGHIVYSADPVVAGGPDPFPVRVGVCDDAGLDDLLTWTDLRVPEKTVRPAVQYSGSDDHVKRFGRGTAGHLASIGDGDGRRGFYGPIFSAVGSMVFRGVPPDQIKAAIRAAAWAAPRDLDLHPDHVIESRVSDSMLDGMIQSSAESEAQKQAERQAQADSRPLLMGLSRSECISRWGSRFQGFIDSQAPDVDVFGLNPLRLGGGRIDQQWRKLSALTDPLEVARVARAILFRLFRRLRVEFSADEIIDRLVASLPPDYCSLLTMRRLIDVLRWGVEQNSRLLDSHRVSADRLVGVTLIEGLRALTPQEIADHDVFLAIAGCGRGKTQKVAIPWSRVLRDGGYRFVAVGPREVLVTELASGGRFNLVHRGNRVSPEEMRTRKPDVGLCPASILKPWIQPSLDGAGAVFVDEFDQTLRFAASREICSGEHYAAFQRLLQGASKVMVADAGMSDFSVDWLRETLPGKRVLVMREAPTSPLKVRFGSGRPAVNTAVAELERSVRAGDNCWVVAPEKKVAKSLALRLRKLQTASGEKIRVRVIHGDNKVEERKFLADVDAGSKLEQVVIHTSVISSGISVEHLGCQHFSRGFAIGSCVCVSPAEVFQMLHRVRYLTDWVVALDWGRSAAGGTEEQIQRGLLCLAEDAGVTTGLTDYDRFRIAVERDRDVQLASATTALWQVLEYSGAELSMLVPDEDAADSLRESSKEVKRETIAALLAARDIEPQEADQMRGARLTEGQKVELTRFRIRECLAVFGRDLTEADVALYDDGRGERVLQRSIALCEGRALPNFTKSSDLTSCRFTEAMPGLYRTLFAGIDLHGVITREDSSVVRERLLDDDFRSMCVESGLVPKTWAGVRGIPDDAVSVTNEILRRAGFLPVRFGKNNSRFFGGKKSLEPTADGRCVTVADDAEPLISGSTDGATMTDRSGYRISVGSFTLMREWAERRGYRFSSVPSPLPGAADRWSRILGSAPSCFLLTASTVSELLADGTSVSAVTSWLRRSPFPEDSGWMTFQFRLARGGKPISVASRIGVDAAVAALGLVGSVVEGSIKGVEPVQAEPVEIELPEVMLLGRLEAMRDVPGYRVVHYQVEGDSILRRAFTRLSDLFDIYPAVSAAHGGREVEMLDFADSWFGSYIGVPDPVRPDPTRGKASVDVASAGVSVPVSVESSPQGFTEPDEAVPEFDFESGVLLGWQVPHDHDEATMPECPAEPDWVLAYWDSTEFAESFDREAAMVDEEPA